MTRHHRLCLLVQTPSRNRLVDAFPTCYAPTIHEHFLTGTMADYERTILEFYQLPTPYPSEWPAEKDLNEISDDDDKTQKLKRRKSRYQALERAVSDRRSIVPGSESGQGGVGNMVQKDEPDPLGSSDSVVRTLKQLGLQDDTRLRTSNRVLMQASRDN